MVWCILRRATKLNQIELRRNVLAATIFGHRLRLRFANLYNRVHAVVA